ncbi:carbohydrate sulfotransferase 10 isoform X2 [Patella vulgata]|uniref:carbohydrate sulfotransferase 10 isoform X2 n=1 Tax=Patella vulgata TaxID=6465 RepID=UPI00217F3109|nr:carbohydrate sulfotransferase 10 isoform X2 [Patella vulgata]
MNFHISRKKLFLYMGINFLAIMCVYKVYLSENNGILQTIHLLRSKPTDYIQLELSERRNNMSNFCHRQVSQNTTKRTMENIKKKLLYSPEKKFLYCPVEKVGSTFWRRLFLIVNGVSKTNNPFNVSTYMLYSNRYSAIKAETTAIRNSLKFVIVREPYSRLLSAYANKLFDINPVYWSMYGRKVIKAVRKNPSNKSLSCGHDVTFPELVRYVVKPLAMKDIHFNPISDKCSPCDVKYDIIGKMETFKRDTLHVLKKLNLTHLVMSRALQEMEEGVDIDTIKSNTNSLMNYLSQKRTLKCVTHEEAFKRKWRNLQLRGIIGSDVEYPFKDGEEETTTHSQLLAVFLNASRRSGSRKSRRKNRELSFLEAYSKVEKKYLIQLSKYFKNDCSSFSYDCRPTNIFEKNQKPHTKFFDTGGL